MPPLAALLQQLRPATAAERAALGRYRQQLEPLVRRVRGMRDDWVALAQRERDAARLANRAAVNRWELRRLAEQLARVPAPRRAAAAHRDLQRALADAARASQLLANGHRSHKSEAVCDGHVLLVDSVDLLERVARVIGQPGQ